MRGHGEVVKLLMSNATNPEESLFAVNRDGICPFHLALMKDDRHGGSQDAAVAIVQRIGSQTSSLNGADGLPLLTRPVGDAKGGPLNCPRDSNNKYYTWLITRRHFCYSRHRVISYIKQAQASRIVRRNFIYTTLSLADTPLLLAISAHQDKVVKELLEKNPEQASVPNALGELPLSRCLSSATHPSLASDISILNDIIARLDNDVTKVGNLCLVVFASIR